MYYTRYIYIQISRYLDTILACALAGFIFIDARYTVSKHPYTYISGYILLRVPVPTPKGTENITYLSHRRARWNENHNGSILTSKTRARARSVVRRSTPVIRFLLRNTTARTR